jgi:hypothetical protein
LRLKRICLMEGGTGGSGRELTYGGPGEEFPQWVARVMRNDEVPKIGALFRWHPTRVVESAFLGPAPAMRYPHGYSAQQSP